MTAYAFEEAEISGVVGERIGRYSLRAALPAIQVLVMLRTIMVR